MNVREVIEQAERILPGEVAPEGERDPRWHTIIEVSEFIPAEPDAVWDFTLRWGCHHNEDLRMAVATCLLEHLLEHHFDDFFPKVEEAVKVNPNFADTFLSCSKFGDSEEPHNAERFDRLQEKCWKFRKRSR